MILYGVKEGLLSTDPLRILAPLTTLFWIICLSDDGMVECERGHF
ncbi:hypothetical protein PJXGC_gp02 [Liberibacter phage P-JXGC-3]|nr:hypothetical protein PJXGC_gp02 [Liberibacter phage P-JXGC-3]